MLKRNKYYSLLFFLLLFFIAVPAQSSVMKNILVLNSYHKGHEWADSIKRGVQAVVHKEEKSIEVYFEYLETKKHSHIGFSEEQVALFMSKYPSGLFDVIIVTDNNALTFVKNFGNILFPDTPVVFCGINNFRTELVDGIEQITGVVETTDYKATLELMAKLHPKAEKIAVILDKTETGLEIKKEFLKVAQSYKGRFTFEFYQDFLLEEIGAELSKLGSEDLIYLLTFNRDRNSNFISYSNSIKQLSQHSHRPIYGSWDFYMGKGILGGIITSGFEQGKLSATQALKIIAGEKTEGLPVIENIPNKCMFDYVQMKRFGIKTSQLPEDCIVINTPPTFYDKYNKIITLLSFIALFVSVILLWNFRIQKQKQALLIQMNEQLDKRIKEKQLAPAPPAVRGG